MDSIGVYWVNLAAVTGMMFMGWLVSLRYNNVTVVDSLWGVGFIVIAWISLILGSTGTPRGWLLAVLTTIWGLRLTIYISWRNWGKGEDPRYGSWRRRHRERFRLVSLYKVFGLQALFMWVIALCLQFGILAPKPTKLIWLDALGLAIWAVGFLFETIGDWQLARFKSDPENRGKVMDRGLWAYTRHPNYFGEVLVWWGIYVIVLSIPGAWWTLISPAVITLVLLKMTGVVLTEKTILATRPHYRDYMEKTSAFLPWFPKRS